MIFPYKDNVHTIATDFDVGGSTYLHDVNTVSHSIIH